MATPLPQYKRGGRDRKAAGEFAIVGEDGPEIRWVPRGASVIPHAESMQLLNSNAEAGSKILKKWGIPDMPSLMPMVIPPMPHVPKEALNYERNDSRRYYHSIDYDKLGKAVAQNVQFPDMKQLNISMDEAGFKKYLSNGKNITTIMNAIFVK
jgi:phage-related tail protein